MGELDKELERCEQILGNGGKENFSNLKKVEIVRFYSDRHLGNKPYEVVFRLGEESTSFENGDLGKKYSNLAEYCNREE